MELRHGEPAPIGILLSNLGTPEAPTPEALRVYLKEFLSDRRVIEVPRIIWWFILNFWILYTRPKRSAELYAKIWTAKGSPLLIHTRELACKFAGEFARLCPGNFHVTVGMRYGKPSLEEALEELQKKNCRRILVLPLYPQYSAATTATTFDEVTRVLKSWRFLPELRMVNQYCDETEYIAALAKSLEDFWRGGDLPERLLFSFHGLPKKNFRQGDPYFYLCHTTARLVAEKLGLTDDFWQIAFQSRFGEEEWLKPYADQALRDLGKSGVKSVAVVSPGFAVDCLETLEEIAIEYKNVFLNAGGQQFRYVPALNASEEHAAALAQICLRQIRDWV